MPAETPASPPSATPEPHPLSGMRVPLPVTLENARVRLVPLTEAHWPLVLAARVHRDLWKYAANMETEAQFRGYFDAALDEAATRRSVVFAIYGAKGTENWEFAGSTRIANIAVEHARVEIGWTWVLPQFQRSGLNRAAKLLLLTHCFETLGCRRVEFKGHGSNNKSRTALAGIGATYEGLLRSHMVLPDGTSRDSFYFSIIAPEWPEVKAQLAASIL